MMRRGELMEGRGRTAFRLEIAGQARPRMPSMGSEENELERVVTGEKVCLVTARALVICF